MVQEKLKNGLIILGVKTIDIEFDKEDPFFNVNTKEDLEKAEKILND
jgi:molybdopterin-guanine dinucleotide biosynthesis protein A